MSCGRLLDTSTQFMVDMIASDRIHRLVGREAECGGALRVECPRNSDAESGLCSKELSKFHSADFTAPDKWRQILTAKRPESRKFCEKVRYTPSSLPSSDSFCRMTASSRLWTSTCWNLNCGHKKEAMPEKSGPRPRRYCVAAASTSRMTRSRLPPQIFAMSSSE